MPVSSSENVSITSEVMALIVVCRHSLPTRSQPQSCINKRLLCSSLASTLRNPILPKAVSKRKHVGLDDPHFDEDVEKRPNAGEEYDPDGDYIYDARKYFNPDKYREIVAHQEEKKKKEQNKFYYKPFRSHKRQYHDKYRYITDSGYSSVNYDFVGRERLSSWTSSLSDSEYPVDDVDQLQCSDSHPSSSTCHKKVKKKSKHSRHGSHIRESSHKHAKRKKSDVNDKKHKKKKKKKQKRKKSSDVCSMSLCHNDDDCVSNDKHHSKLKHSKRRSRHRSKLSYCQEPPTEVSKVLNCDCSYDKLQSPDLPDSLITAKSSTPSSVSPVSSCERQTAVSPCSLNSVYYQL